MPRCISCAPCDCVLVYGCDDDAFWMTAEAFCTALHFMRALTHLFLNQPTLKTPKKRRFFFRLKLNKLRRFISKYTRIFSFFVDLFFGFALILGKVQRVSKFLSEKEFSVLGAVHTNRFRSAIFLANVQRLKLNRLFHF